MVKTSKDMFSRLDTIPACDGQTLHDGKHRRMQSVAWANIHQLQKCHSCIFIEYGKHRRMQSVARANIHQL